MGLDKRGTLHNTLQFALLKLRGLRNDSQSNEEELVSLDKREAIIHYTPEVSVTRNNKGNCRRKNQGVPGDSEPSPTDQTSRWKPETRCRWLKLGGNIV